MCRLGRAAFVGAFFLIFSGCGEKGESDGNKAGAQVLSFASTPESVVYGESVRLAWETRGASSVILTANGVRIDGGDLPVSGSLELQPERDTTFGLEAVPAQGAVAKREVFVEVRPFGPPRIESFTATPDQTSFGETVVLSWSVQGAERIEISEKGGPLLTVSEALEDSFSVQVRRTTTFLLQAQNASGAVTEEASVQVAERPTLSFAISPSEAEFGQVVELRWEVENASSLTIRDPLGEILYEGPGEDGSTTIVAERTGLYRATAYGPGGEESRTAPLAIEPVIEAFSATVSGEVRPGAFARVEWSVLGAERVIISNGLRDVLNTAETSGAEMLPVGTGGEFSLRAISGSMTTRAYARAQTTEKPLIRDLSTGPLVTAGQGVVGRSTVRWEIDGASKISLVVEPGGLVDVHDKSPRLDEVEIDFVGPGTVTLIATNEAGEAKATIPSPVDPVPTISELFAAPSRAGSGEAVEIRWSTVDAESVVLLQDGESRPVDPQEVVGSFLTGILGAPSHFELLAYNTLGHEVRAELRVEIGAPNNLSFGTGDGMALYRVGTQAELVWANDGGAWLRVINQENGETLCSTSDWLEIREGRCTIPMPEEPTELPLVLEVGNASGTDSQRFDLWAVSGPIISEFRADREEMTQGETLLFSWTVLPDLDGNLPSLELVDDRGVVYPMDDVEPLEGRKRFRVDGWGPYSFTLTARSQVPPPYSKSTEVMVHAIPTVDALASNPPYAEQQGDEVEISWSTTNGASLELYLLGEDGEVAESPFFSTDDLGEVESGSAKARPTLRYPHVRLVVRNPLGYPREADLRVGVDPATIAHFTVNGVSAPGTLEILEGEEVTLSWETLRSSDSLLFEEYIDLSTRPNAVELGALGTGAANSAILYFPEGFTFPYDGGVYDALQIVNSGYVSFDLTVAGTGTNQALPVTSTTVSYRGVDIAPFWDSIRASTIWWEHIEGEVDRLVIQWTGAEFTSTTYNPADLNFQLVLFEDGRFEMRYGEMEGDHGNARALSATIGAQSRDCSSGCAFGEQLVYNTEQEHSLEGRVYRFNGLQGFQANGSTPVPMTEKGSLTFQPSETRNYLLRTWNGHSEHEESLRVVVHSKAKISAWTEPAEPAPGEPVVLHWEASDLTSLEILDGSGALVYTADPSELQSGSLSLGAFPEGNHGFTLRGVGQLPRDTIELPIEVLIYAPFSLDDFKASASRIKYGESVDLSWAATNATSVQIEAIPGGALTLPPSLESGTVTHSPKETTTYVLTVESYGRTDSAELTVEVRQAWFDEVLFSRTEVQRGESLEVSWEFQDPTGDAVVVVEPELRQYVMREIPGNFSSIASTGKAEALSGSATTGFYQIDFPEGFSFPYFGKEITQGRAMVPGYFNFGFNQTTASTADFIMPRPHTTYPDGVMGLYWMNLNVGTGGVYTQYVKDPSNPAEDHLIIEWSGFDYNTASHKPGDVNFQLVLFRSGAFEYRYGNISSNDAAIAQGSSSGAGFQNPEGTLGYHIWYNYTLAPANRTWRYEPPSEGFRIFEPEHSGPYRICLVTPAWKECEERFITVFEPGDILISELMVEPATGSTQWFEVRNIAPGPFDLEGKTIRMGERTHTINSGGALIVPSGGYAVLAQSADPDLSADYVYGSSMSMEAPSGNVAIEWDGTVMGETSWNASWTFQPGVSLELHALNHRAFQESRSSFGEYCESAVPLGTGSFGTPGRHEGACAESEGYEVDFASPNDFIDIRETGTLVLELHGTTAAYAIPGGIGFTIPFFDEVASELWANSNGLIGLSGAPSTSSANRLLGTGSGVASGQGLIVPFWDLLNTNPGSTFHWERRTIAGSQVTILQWTDYRYSTTTPPGTLTFQAQIWENGDIAIVLGDSYPTVKYSTYQHYHGHLATVGGIESMAGTEAILYQHNEGVARGHQSFYFRKL